ncbi:MAG: UDP-N-acetylglucosamine 1-carboxyvinyltransferase, partial [Alphaproteobacteria bacterium]|nr:UDP-N-acetylglucosamine 1-carboxyvinyltransferase [Alphaproteobacteria bacterium]
MPRRPHGLRGAEIALPQPSVGVTENLLLAGMLASGRTIIFNAAREPEIVDLIQCLTAMGARVTGRGTDVLTIESKSVTGAVHTVMSDRIELGTVACAAAVTDGEVLLTRARKDLLGAAASTLTEAGVVLEQVDN